MTQVRTLVTRAYRKLEISGSGEALDGDNIEEGVTAFNGMLHEWKLHGIDLTYTSLAAGDTFPLGPEYEDGVVHLLAERISPDYSTPPNFDADKFFRAIQAAYLVIAENTFPSGIMKFPSAASRSTP